MADSSQKVVISVLADTKKFTKAFKSLGRDTGLTKIGEDFISFGKTVAKGIAIGATAVAGLAATTIGAASELQQSTGAVEAVFGSWADSVISNSKKAASQYGISASEFQQNSALLASLLKNQGVAQDELGGKTQALIGWAADLSSMFGGTTSEAVEALSNSFRGEFDAMEKYGVSLKQSSVNAKMAAEGLTQAEAIMALIEEQGGAAAGNFAKESNTWGGQVQRLQAKFQDFRAELGTYLLPVLTAVVTWISDHMEPAFKAVTGWIDSTVVPAFRRFGDYLTGTIVPKLQDLAKTFQSDVLPKLQSLADWILNTGVPALVNFGKWVIENKTILLGLIAPIAGVVAAFKGFEVISQLILNLKNATTAVKTFSTVLKANPAMIWITAIGALVAALVYFFTQTETGRQIISTAWEAIQSVAQTVGDWFTGTLFPALNAAWETLQSVISSVADWVMTYVVPVFQAGGELIKAIFDYIGTAFELLYSAVILPVALAIETAWNLLWTGIKAVWDLIMPPLMAVMEAAWNQVKTVFTFVWETMKNVVETILGVIRGVITTITGLITGDWSRVWEGIKSVFSSIWEGIKSQASIYMNALKGTISNILNGIKGVWEGVWNGIKSFVETIWDGLVGIWDNGVSTVSGIFERIGNAIKSPFETAFNSIKSLWNNTVGKISFTVPDWVPGIGGKGWSAPKLAKGGIVTSATMALIGEGNEPEAVIPLSKLRQMLGGSLDTGKTKTVEVKQTVQNTYYATVEVSRVTEVEEIKSLFANASWQLASV